MNSFERFGIKHLSPSSLNLWRAAPGLWTLRYVGGIKDESSAAMRRGTAVENGLAALLRGMPLDGATAVAHQNFDLNSKDSKSTEEKTERDLIGPMLRELTKWKAPGPLNATQIKVEVFFDPVPIPVEGWIDFAFDSQDIDLKSTRAIPRKEPRPDNLRQAAFYRYARKAKAGGILYVSKADHQYYEVTDEQMNDAIEGMVADALALNNFLARCETRNDALKSLPIDWSNFQAPKVKIPLSDILLAG